MPLTEVRSYRATDGSVPILEWLSGLEKKVPNVHAKCVARLTLLAMQGFDLRRPAADLLRDGIYELRIRNKTTNYRMLYFFYGRRVVIVSHGFTKEDKVPDREIEAAIEHRSEISRDLSRYSIEMELP